MNDYDIVCIAPHSWKQMWRRRHHLMSRLADRHKVLFAQPGRWLPLVAKQQWEDFAKGHAGINQVQKQLWICTLYNPLPLEEITQRAGFALVRWVNERACLFQLRRAMKVLGFERPSLWLYNTPHTAFLAKRIPGCLTVCDVYDKYTAYVTTDEWMAKYIALQEKAILRRSDVVFTASDSLQQYCQIYNKRCFLIPNGVDELFLEPVSSSPELPLHLVHVPSPRVGYVGGVFDKIDLNLLIHLAKARPKLSLVIIGPVKMFQNQKRGELRTLRSLSNVFFLGEKKMQDLPSFYAGLDVCLMPYDVSVPQMAWASCVLKAWEYMAVGKPIVSTDYPTMDSTLRELVLVAGTTEGFVREVDRALTEDLTAQTRRGQELAKLNTWGRRVTHVERLINETLLEKTSGD